jgi:hypothetical protein
MDQEAYMITKNIPDIVISRLPLYLRSLQRKF